MKCPICGEKESKNQPQSGTHCYTTVFECGTELDFIYNDPDYQEFSQRCDQPHKRSFMEELMYPDKLHIAYAQQELPQFCKRSIFLAGPTPRDADTPSWRPEAIEILKKMDFKGWVFVPEMENGWTSDFEYGDQIEWEHNALQRAKIILFWVPRDVKNMPAFTTNIEWGYWMAKNPNKLVLGYPKKAQKMKYMEYYADKLGIPSTNKLKDAIEIAVNRLENPESFHPNAPFYD